MKVVTITCDKCGKDISDNKSQKWNMQVRYVCNKELWEGSASATNGITWCRSCFELTGLVPPVERKEIGSEIKLSIDSLIREIVKEELAGGHYDAD